MLGRDLLLATLALCSVNDMCENVLGRFKERQYVKYEMCNRTHEAKNKIPKNVSTCLGYILKHKLSVWLVSGRP